MNSLLEGAGKEAKLAALHALREMGITTAKTPLPAYEALVTEGKVKKVENTFGIVYRLMLN